MSDAIVKNLSFGKEASEKVFNGIKKLTSAVSSTLGASGKCVLLEDSFGRPVITKDGVTVADSIILLDPVENMGATLLKEAARKTVREAGDGTTTATVLAHAILDIAYSSEETNTRQIKDGINSATEKVINYLDSIALLVDDTMLDQIATISTNNDPELGALVGNAFRSVGNTGIFTIFINRATSRTFIARTVIIEHLRLTRTTLHLIANREIHIINLLVHPQRKYVPRNIHLMSVVFHSASFIIPFAFITFDIFCLML